MVSILCVGDDIRLLESRVAVLARTGAGVQWSTSWDAASTIAQKDYDLVVLCHSLKCDTAQELYAAAHARKPTSLVLRLTPLWSGDETQLRKGCDAITGVEPDQLVRLASELLQGQTCSAGPR